MNELAGDWYLSSDSALSEEIFSELYESEDEKVRKEIMQLIQGMHDADPRKERWLAWLEKQGEKPHGKSAREAIKEEKVDNANKVEPKFKVGDWVVSPNGVYWHIDKISNNRYEVTSNTGESSNWQLDTNIYHKFTIQDAKKGDILACDKCILIFDQLSEFNNEQVLMDICHCTSKGFYWQDTKDRDLWVPDGFKPATKDQCNTLFAKMQEAGFEWDAEKKELKKIEQEPIDCNEEYYNEELKNALFTSLRDAREQYLREKNAAWSDEDENMIRGLIAICDELVGRHSCYPVENCDIEKLKNWLKALKQRIRG